jgi:signal transduction histidine kinase
MLSTELLERQLLDALPFSIYTVDLDGRVTSVHNARARVGDDLADVAGFPRTQVDHAMQQLRTGRATVVSWEHRSKDDVERVSLAQMTPLHDEAHAVTGFVVSVTDITTLTTSRDTVVDASHALASVVDIDRIYPEVAQLLRRVLRPDLVVIAIADENAAEPHVAYESGSDGDRSALQQRFDSAWRSCIRDRSSVVTSSNGATEITAPLSTGAHAFGALTVATDDIDSPEQLAAADRYVTALATQVATALERARDVALNAQRRHSQAIGEVAAGVAQELRNPIFGISSAAQLLRFRAREDPVMEKNAGRILREVERLNRMVSTLLELGRPIALKLTHADPDAVWDDVIESERGRLESKSLVIRRTRPDAPATVAIDGEQLAQAFRCVLANAVEAAPEASDITLQSLTLPNGGWRCRLANGGAPIPADVLPRVFEPFLSTKPGSTGVGLALTRRIIEEHQGTMGLESKAEVGTIVSISLPVAAKLT